MDGNFCRNKGVGGLDVRMSGRKKASELFFLNGIVLRAFWFMIGLCSLVGPCLLLIVSGKSHP